MRERYMWERKKWNGKVKKEVEEEKLALRIFEKSIWKPFNFLFYYFIIYVYHTHTHAFNFTLLYTGKNTVPRRQLLPNKKAQCQVQDTYTCVFS